MDYFFKFLALNFICFILSVLIVSAIMKVRIMAEPIYRSSHDAPTPTAGGIGPVLAFLLTFSAAFIFGLIKPSLFTWQYRYFLTSVCILAFIGFMDDWQGTSYRLRLVIQIICAGLLVSSEHVIQLPLLGEELSYTQKFFTMFVIVGIINATNFMDGLDGLLTGSTLICLIFAFFIIDPKTALHILPYNLLFFSLLGFWIFNFPKAKIFMGDTGSTFVGIVLVYIALEAQKVYHGNSSLALIHKGFIYTLAPMGFLWFDVIFTLLRRMFMKGVRLTQAHRDHMIHILHDDGYSHKLISALYFLSVIVMGFMTLFVHQGIMTFITGFSVYCILQSLFCLWVFSKRGFKLLNS